MKRVFISYAQEDSSFAQRLVAALGDVNVDGWTDQADIAAGTAIPEAVRSAISRTSAMVVLVSPRSLGSRWVSFEIGAALTLGRRIIAVLVEGAHFEQDLPEFLQGVLVLDARNKSIDQIVEEVREAVG